MPILRITSDNALRIPLSQLPYSKAWKIYITDNTLYITSVTFDFIEDVDYDFIKKIYKNPTSKLALNIYLTRIFKNRGLLPINQYDFEIIHVKTNLTKIKFTLKEVYKKKQDHLENVSKAIMEEINSIDKVKEGSSVFIKGTVTDITADVVEVLVTPLHGKIQHLKVHVNDVKLNKDLPRPGDHLMGKDGCEYLIINSNNDEYPIEIVSMKSFKCVDIFPSIEIAMKELDLDKI